jgi:hypothetical protein
MIKIKYYRSNNVQTATSFKITELGSSPFEMKWRESILWFRLNITDITSVHLNDVAVCTLLDL